MNKSKNSSVRSTSVTSNADIFTSRDGLFEDQGLEHQKYCMLKKEYFVKMSSKFRSQKRLTFRQKS